MGRFLPIASLVAVLAGFGLLVALRVIDQGLGHVTAWVLAGGVFTIALAVRIP